MGKFKRGKNKKSNQQPQKNDSENQIEGSNQKMVKKENSAYQLFDSNIFFEQYYKHIFKAYDMNDDEFQFFLNILKKQLDTTFRVNIAQPYYQGIIKKLEDPKLVSQFFETSNTNIEEEKEEEKKNDKFDVSEIQLNPIPFISNKTAWKLSIGPHVLKRNEQFKKLHEFINKLNQDGIITRQELVSYLPPIFLDPKNNESILDMCAAPGSKTSQMLELMINDCGIQECNGGIVANDLDWKRAAMLIHQINRINTSQLCVVNHNGQYFPKIMENINLKEGYCYDKVLADVPCGGDGTIRKNPKKWQTWNTNESMGQHTQQILILQRALQLTKIGGYTVYSTCSMNPIEDEAVLCEIFRKYGTENLELIDLHSKIPGLKTRKGMSKWDVLQMKQLNQEEINQIKETDIDIAKLFNIYRTWDQFKEAFGQTQEKKTKIKSSMFPFSEEIMTNDIQIQNTVRILPHDQDSGGFFIALLKKTGKLKFQKDQLEIKEEQKIEYSQHKAKVEEQVSQKKEETSTKEENLQTSSNIQSAIIEENKNMRINDNFQKLDKEIWLQIKQYYGIQNDTLFPQLIQNYSKKKTKVFYISKALKNIISYDRKRNYKYLSIGSKAFAQNNQNHSLINNSFRITQECALQLLQYFTKRIIKCSFQTFKELLKMLQQKEINLNEIQDEDLKQQINKEDAGTILIYFEEILPLSEGKVIKDVMVFQNFKTQISSMVSKEQIAFFQMKYL